MNVANEDFSTLASKVPISVISWLGRSRLHGEMDTELARTFLTVVALYLALAATVVWVLRTMSRRFREQASEDDDRDVPYGPRELPPEADREPEPVG